MGVSDDNNKLWKLLDGIEDIPTLPMVVLQVLEMTNDSDVSIKDLANLLLADQVLASKILRMVNSAQVGPSHRITSIREAIVYMGLNGIRNIVLTTSMMNMFSSSSRVFDPLAFWEHSFGSALVSAQIANKIEYEDPEQAYLAGLVHDIGEVVLGHFMRGEFETALMVANETATDLHLVEKNILGFSHTDLGPWLVSKWNFPKEIAEVTMYHHNVQLAEINPPLVAIVHLADLFCRMRGLGHDYYERIHVTIEDSYAWAILKAYSYKVKNMDIERFTFELDEKVEDIKSTVRHVYQSGY